MLRNYKNIFLCTAAVLVILPLVIKNDTSILVNGSTILCLVATNYLDTQQKIILKNIYGFTKRLYKELKIESSHEKEDIESLIGMIPLEERKKLFSKMDEHSFKSILFIKNYGKMHR